MEVIEVLVAGRQAYAWDGNEGRSPVDDPADGRLWASHSKLDADLHLPVFDMDMPRTPDVERVVSEVFPGETEWVPSTTEGHHHVYVHDVLFDTDAYFRTLNELCLRLNGVTDPFPLLMYLSKNRPRRATFVRMPHVKKQPGEMNSA